MEALANSAYLVQEHRYKKDKVYTARADAQLKDYPNFIFNSIFVAGYPWNVISDKGEAHPELALVSTRAAFGMWALWKNDYTSSLMTVIDELYNADRGWYEGRYEQTGGYEETVSLATNAIVLESLFYKTQGVIYQGASTEAGYLENRLSDEFHLPGRCFPVERAQ